MCNRACLDKSVAVSISLSFACAGSVISVLAAKAALTRHDLNKEAILLPVIMANNDVSEYA